MGSGEAGIVTLREVAEINMRTARAHELNDGEIYDLLNNPPMQVGYLEKQLNQQFIR